MNSFCFFNAYVFIAIEDKTKNPTLSPHAFSSYVKSAYSCKQIYKNILDDGRNIRFIPFSPVAANADMVVALQTNTCVVLPMNSYLVQALLKIGNHLYFEQYPGNFTPKTILCCRNEKYNKE